MQIFSFAAKEMRKLFFAACFFVVMALFCKMQVGKLLVKPFLLILSSSMEKFYLSKSTLEASQNLKHSRVLGGTFMRLRTIIASDKVPQLTQCNDMNELCQ
jgi:hypothetical protein